MSSAGKTIIVAALLVAVGAVIAVKQRRATQECGSACARAAKAMAIQPAASQPATAPVEEKPLPRIVDIGAGTCMQCKQMAIVLDAFAKDFAGRVGVEIIDIRKNELAAELYNYRLIPTQIFLDAAGKELFRHEGFFSREAILAKWKELGLDLSGKPAPTTQAGAK